MAETSQTDERHNDAESFARRKRLRKGTRSCTECRRRKIRCNFPSGESDICSPCSASGSRCTSQKTPPNPDVENLTLRDRVARLESVLETVLQRLPSEDVIVQERNVRDVDGEYEAALDANVPHANSSHPRRLMFDDSAKETADIGVSDYHDSQAPFISVLDDAELLLPSRNSFSTTNALVSAKNAADDIKRKEHEDQEICQRLRSSLPPYDQMIATLKDDGSWWCHFHRKTHPSTKSRESLATYAAQLYISNEPPDLGTLVVAYARSTGNDHQLYSLVERLVISDTEYCHTIRGLECLLLLAKVYVDAGQPRRSWYLTRQGLSTAQLMGLYRHAHQDSRSAIIWQCLYHSDRFTSLLLGLPYAVNDAHFPHLLVANTGDADFVPHMFTHQCASIASKILDRNLRSGTPSYTTTINLDEQLSSIAAILPPEWWDVPSKLSGTEVKIDHVRTRMQQQFYFFQLKSYVHLPYLSNSSEADPYYHSKLICIDSARQMLKRFFIYHSTVNGEKLFECKTADFMGFTAAAILLIGLSKLHGKTSINFSAEDSRMISLAKVVFQENERRGCSIASQCSKALAMLSSTEEAESQNDIKIPIPYFGVVVRKRIKQNGAAITTPHEKDPAHAVHSAPSYTPAMSHTSSAMLSSASTDIARISDSVIDSAHLMLNDISWEVDEFGNFPTSASTQWLDSGTMDIDQDWTAFLNNNVS